MEIISILISLVALIPIIYFLRDRYKLKPHEVDYASGNVSLTRFVNPNNTESGKLALVVYCLKIVNRSTFNMTIKEVVLRYSLNMKDYTTDSYVVNPGAMYDKSGNIYNYAVIENVGKDRIVLMDWRNLRSVIGAHKVLSPGEILSGSALFILDIVEIEQLSEIENMRLIVRDFRGKKTEHPLKIDQKWLIGLTKGAEFEYRSFTIRDENIEFNSP